MAAEEGFEPSQTESESAVLPLHNSAMAGTILSQSAKIVKPFFKKTFFAAAVGKRFSRCSFCRSCGGIRSAAGKSGFCLFPDRARSADLPKRESLSRRRCAPQEARFFAGGASRVKNLPAVFTFRPALLRIM